MSARVGDGLTALARAMRSKLESNAKVFDLGGDGARRAARSLAMHGVTIERERGDAAVAAAVGSSAGGASVWLLASGGATELAARAMREARRAQASTLVAVVPSHGDDVGGLVPEADGSDLAALDGAPCERWFADSAHEIESLVERAANTRGEGLSRAIVFDYRAVGLRITSLSPRASSAADGVSSEGLSDARVALVSLGSAESASRAARWLTDSGVPCESVPFGAAAKFERAELAVVHELGAPFERRRWALAEWVERAMPRARVVLLPRGPATASAFCEAVASDSAHRRAGLSAASRSLGVQLVGPPATRFAAVELVIEALSLANLSPSAECVEPTHARIDCDAGSAGATGTGGWVLIVPGLSVQAPIEAGLRGGAMIAEASIGSPLLALDAPDAVVGPEDQAALVVAAVHAELELRENQRSVEALANVAAAFDRDRGGGSPWAKVRERSLHLRSLR